MIELLDERKCVWNVFSKKYTRRSQKRLLQKANELESFGVIISNPHFPQACQWKNRPRIENRGLQKRHFLSGARLYAGTKNKFQ